MTTERQQECAATGAGHHDGPYGPKRQPQCLYCGEAPPSDTVGLFRKFGLHASADALAARDAYREGKTCRTCVHLDSDPRDEPCATCTRFGKWQDARAEQSKAPNGVMGTLKESGNG